MDVSAELAAHAARFSSNTQDPEAPITVDAALLAAFDEGVIEKEEYDADLDSYLLNLTTSTTQHLLSSLFSLPTKKSSLGPMAQLPLPITHLPREKPLPKEKPLTKWERFAKERGISHKVREKDVWDDESQSWVPRYGRGGKNREVEDVWIREIKGGDHADHDPIATSKKERKERVAKNESQRARNSALAAGSSTSTASLASRLPAPASIVSAKANSKSKGNGGEPSQQEKKSKREERKKDLDRQMLISKVSTASMGVFDKKIEGEPKVKGIKRKFEPTSAPSFASEKSSALSILSSVGKPKEKKQKVSGGAGVDGDVNVRKALRFKDREERLKGGSSTGGGRGGKSGGGKKRK